MIIKILQWNIHCKENPDHIVQFIKENNPDIITAQELINNTEKSINTAKYIAQKLKYNYFFKEGDTWFPVKNNKTSQGNAVFSRFLIKKNEFSYLTVPHHNPPDANFEGRVYIETSINVNNFLLTIATTHLGFSPRFVINERRKTEVDNLIPLIKNQKNYIFTGDLNSSPDSYTIQQINKYLINAGPDCSQPTWTTKPFDYHGQFKENKLCWRLDYVFTTKDIKIIKAEIIKTEYSDHLPILLTINL